MYGSVCICQIDAAISDAPKPIGWPLWVRASYYLHVGRRPPYEGTNSTRAAPGAQTCHQQRPELQRNQNCRLTQIQRNWSRNQNSPLTPESRGIGPEIRIAGLLPSPLPCWNNFDQPFLKVSSRIPDENTVPSPFSFNSWVGSVGRVVKCKSLNTCQNNKMTNDKFKLVKTPPHGQKPSEVFV